MVSASILSGSCCHKDRETFTNPFPDIKIAQAVSTPHRTVWDLAPRSRQGGNQPPYNSHLQERVHGVLYYIDTCGSPAVGCQLERLISSKCTASVALLAHADHTSAGFYFG